MPSIGRGDAPQGKQPKAPPFKGAGKPFGSGAKAPPKKGSKT